MCSEVLILEVRKMLLNYLLILFLLLICSGYDFGYLIKILTNSNLPEEELDFFEILRLFFPVIYDVKYLMKSCKNLKVSNLLMVWNKFCIWRQSTSCLKILSLFLLSGFALMVHIKHCCLKLYIFNIKGIVRSRQDNRSIFIIPYQLKHHVGTVFTVLC